MKTIQDKKTKTFSQDRMWIFTRVNQFPTLLQDTVWLIKNHQSFCHSINRQHLRKSHRSKCQRGTNRLSVSLIRLRFLDNLEKINKAFLSFFWEAHSNLTFKGKNNLNCYSINLQKTWSFNMKITKNLTD
jgi:hypothetical protein